MTTWVTDGAKLETQTHGRCYTLNPKSECQEHVIIARQQNPDSTYGGYRGFLVQLGMTVKDRRGKWGYAPPGGRVQPSDFDSRADALAALIAYRLRQAERAIQDAQTTYNELKLGVDALGPLEDR